MRLFLLCLACVSFVGLSQEKRQPPPLPDFPDYPAISKVTENTHGEVYFSSVTPGDYKWLVLPEQTLATTTVKGQLFLPPGASADNPVPAMVILHGSGGILPSRELAYGQWMADHGIAGLVVNSYEARGVTEETPYGLRVAIVSDADETADAYSALTFLNQHPAINPEKIGLMGFSYGGMATRAALDSRIQQNMAPQVSPFALHLDYYGPCHFDLQTAKTTGAPLFSLRGAEDKSNDLEACARLENRLRDAGSAVGSTIFPSAGHGWEMATPRQFIATLNPAPCKQVLLENGDWQIDGTTIAVPAELSRQEQYHFRLGLLGQMQQSCMSEGYIMGQDKQTHSLSNLLLAQYTAAYLLN
ncbi:dienelactone hydrolase family protein [Aliiglaciecola sp. 3_MG-2023]|uniref:dienelactone hydrolase family protein n=1 Tax=Aliiglaciecola sp. 3_MG-2023 TaxID=3062644 RepID=UPI0026E36039|nr:dienelactone hydrolase family protein [Aliiglaciecola sp. 3_MG-2023]MDO6693696.1 dienelactone hydrolase family protein [Aliiglaciecola sp. 3_MG-2023]